MRGQENARWPLPQVRVGQSPTLSLGLPGIRAVHTVQCGIIDWICPPLTVAPGQGETGGLPGWWTVGGSQGWWPIEGLPGWWPVRPVGVLPVGGLPGWWPFRGFPGWGQCD